MSSGSYAKGYDQGFSDGKNGRSKVNASHFGKGLATSFNPFGSVDEFESGYHEGYRKGCEARNR
jgi:hypothetical protein